MLSVIDLRGTDGDLDQLLPAPLVPGEVVAEPVADIIEAVRQSGDSALRELTLRFDGVDIENPRVLPEQISDALARTSKELLHSLEVAYDRIVAYHAHEFVQPTTFDDGDITVQPLVIPVERAGCYAPGGRARYPSSVLMCVAPARVAGVQDIVLCVPPNADGIIDDVTLAAAAVAGVKEIYAVGGAQAIAAMALGTDSIPKVDVIVGPGNSYVAEAKRQLAGTVGVASAFAGPSEIVVVADETTPPALAAIDLMVQAEHGPDGLAWLITWDQEVAAAIDTALVHLVDESPRKADLLATMQKSGICVLVDSAEDAMSVSNHVAPEHLELLVENYDELLAKVSAAGAVFCGVDAPASLGDYAVGPNHVLPTNRSARFSSALRADDFVRHIHVVQVEPSGFERLAPTVIALAQAEGLPAHADSIAMRLHDQ